MKLLPCKAFKRIVTLSGCFLNTDNYGDAVLKAVNLGDDTDTVAAVAGGLAGIYYGFESIPTDWINQLAKKNNILDLAHRLEVAMAMDKG